MDRVEIEKGIFLHNIGALYIPETGTAAVSDMHIGCETSASDEGAPLPGSQREKLLSKIETILSTFSPERLVVVGDMKHNFDRNLSQEWDEVLEMTERITSVCELVVVKGNHDNYLASILHRYGIPLLDKYKEGEVCFAHGHKSISWEGLLVMGHEHPSIGLSDNVGGRLKLPCFLTNTQPRVVVLPAMSPMAFGSDILRASRFFSPILQRIPRSNMSVWASSEIGLLSFGGLEPLRNTLAEQ